MISKSRKLLLKRAIAKIENPYPDDNLILSYPDFLKVRNCLQFYQFNPILFHKLLQLANSLWTSDLRINRLSLLLKIKQYYHVSPFYVSNINISKKKGLSLSLETTLLYVSKNTISNKLDLSLSLETRLLLFELFKKVFDDYTYISNKQLEFARKICNNFLINIQLTAVEEEWFSNNASASELILNRVLRYPVKSEILSNWAKNNFYDNNYRSRRAELIGLIIDQNPSFEIDSKVLIDDFEYLNISDMQAINDYKEECDAIEIIERDLSDVFHLRKSNSMEGYSEVECGISLSFPELKLAKRFYGGPITFDEKYSIEIPEFRIIRNNFLSKLDVIKKVTMIWAIHYSHIDINLKTELLKKYYCDKTSYTLYRVSNLDKNINLLKWLIEQL